jgi:transcriptional regulator with XRE-family HTH domain
MSKRKPLDKAEARERRDRMLEAAAAARLSLTDGVREMRTIAGMTQEEFARHRGVSARVIKAIELGQGNPTVATMNRIGQFFGLEVAFVPIKRDTQAGDQPQSTVDHTSATSSEPDLSEAIHKAVIARDELDNIIRRIGETAARLDAAHARKKAKPRSA